jgi:hypothetical protein
MDDASKLEFLRRSRSGDYRVPQSPIEPIVAEASNLEQKESLETLEREVLQLLKMRLKQL